MSSSAPTIDLNSEGIMEVIAELQKVTNDITERSAESRAAYLTKMVLAEAAYKAKKKGPRGDPGGCSNCSHAFAASSANEKQIMSEQSGLTVGIIDSGNDLISSGQPFERFRGVIKRAAEKVGAVAKHAGSTPSMCDGVTQGYKGMDFSLFSRDVIAKSAAIGMSTGTLDAVLRLGDCDKIDPALFMATAKFGYLPSAAAPAGPMATGESNEFKAKARTDFKERKITQVELQAAENKSYHSAGICTFLGTAHTNNILREVMGLVVPGSSLVNEGTKLRDALTRDVTERLAKGEVDPLYKIIDEKNFVNALVMLMAIGGSTNHTMHIPAMAAHMGIDITWDDFDRISKIVPLLVRVYPNGKADINDFQKAGGLPVVIEALMKAGMLHNTNTILGENSLAKYTEVPFLSKFKAKWKKVVNVSKNLDIIRSVSDPFSKEGGLNLLKGNLGRAMIKVSAVKDENRVVDGEAVVFNSQEDLIEASQAWVRRHNSKGKEDKLSKHELSLADKFNAESFVAVVRGQSANHNGMPEQHKCIDALKIMQREGKNVAFLSDGRLSGASGAIPAALHTYGGRDLFKLRDGDRIKVDSVNGTVDTYVSKFKWALRRKHKADVYEAIDGGELFEENREKSLDPEEGAIMPFPGMPKKFSGMSKKEGDNDNSAVKYAKHVFGFGPKVA